MLRLISLIFINALLALVFTACGTENYNQRGPATESTTERSQDDGLELPSEETSADAETYFKLGMLYQAEEGRDEESVANFSKAIDLDPAHALAYSNRGFVYMTALRNRVEACSDFRRACELEECGNYNTAIQAGHCVFRLLPEPTVATVDEGPSRVPAEDFTNEYTLFPATHVGAEAEGEYDRKRDIVVPASNPDVLHVLRMSSPSFTGCMLCSKLYDSCFGEEAALEKNYEVCKSKWEVCVVEQKASCRLLMR